MKRKNPKMECPCNADHKDLSLHITTQLTFIRIPIVNGKIIPADNLLRDVQLAGDTYLIRYSDVKSETKVAVSKEEMIAYIYCPRCEKMYDLPKEANISCKDVD